MANQLKQTRGRKRMGRWTFSAMLLTAVGCGFPHDRYASDPLLGNFNRPICATPPIWTGGDPGVSPAWDAGARVGLPSPDVPARSNPILDRMFIMPTFSGSMGVGNIFHGSSSSGSSTTGSGSSSGTGSSSSSSNNSRPGPNYTGAHLLTAPAPMIDGNRFMPGVVVTANSVTPRTIDTNTILTSGAAIEPNVIMISKPISMKSSMKDPRAVISVEEGESILQVCGAKSMVMESQPTGEWRFVCTISEGGEARHYEARAGEQIEAVRAVMWQVKNER